MYENIEAVSLFNWARRDVVRMLRRCQRGQSYNHKLHFEGSADDKYMTGTLAFRYERDQPVSQ
jgi:hypothetical protein